MLGSNAGNLCERTGSWGRYPVCSSSTTRRSATAKAARERPFSETVRTLHLEVGVELFPGYVLVRILGQGGFGVVWEAEAPGGVHVALKFVRLDRRGANRELRAFEIVRNVRHPHLLDIQFALRHGNDLVLAMLLCDQSLRDRLRALQAQGQCGVPLAELLGYMRELAAAVDYLNEPRHPVGDGRLAGIQHRDIKPQNIMLCGGSARLADFGLAKLLEANLEAHSGCMSPHYVAPEELRGQICRRSDQYALAVTYHQLRTGRLPFTGTIGEVLDGHLHRPPDLASLSAGEAEVVARALAKRPEDRWPTCREFVNQLERVTTPPRTDFLTSEPKSTEAIDDEETEPSSPALRAAADPEVRSRVVISSRDHARPDASRPAGPQSHRDGHSRIPPRRLHQIAVAFGLAGLTVMLSASLVPPSPPVRAVRGEDQASFPARRGHSHPTRQVPARPRGPSSGRRTRNPSRGSKPWTIRRFDVCWRAASPPPLDRKAHDLERLQARCGRRCTTCMATSGSGAPTGTRPITLSSHAWMTRQGLSGPRTG